MAKAKSCVLVLNNKWGYVCGTIMFDSINQAYKYGKEMGMAGRIYVNKRLVKTC